MEKKQMLTGLYFIPTSDDEMKEHLKLEKG